MAAFLVASLSAPAEEIPVELSPRAKQHAALAIGDLHAERTTADARTAFIAERLAFIQESLSKEPDTENWPGALWAVMLVQDRRPLVRQAVEKGLGQLADLPERLHRPLLQAASALYPGEFTREIAAALPKLGEPRAFTAAAAYLLAEDATAPNRAHIRTVMEATFPERSQTDPRLVHLMAELDTPPAEAVAARPPLVDLLKHEYAPGRPVLFSFQRVDRRQPGLAVIRGTGGRFLRHEDGTLFAVSHLAHAKTNLPATVTYGNSPEGVYTIVGTGEAGNQFIGPTPYLGSRVPGEASVADFRHVTGDGREWSLDVYTEMLPESWRGYAPFREAYYAGMAGRGEMICHGTTIEPGFFEGRPYYPLTPSAGCLVTREVWSPRTGRLVQSDQYALLKAWLSTGTDRGHLVVVELDNAPRPVTLDEVVMDLLAAERSDATGG